MTVKNFRVSVSLAGFNAANPGIVWALVYVPSTMLSRRVLRRLKWSVDVRTLVACD